MKDNLQDLDWKIGMNSEGVAVFECQYCDEKLGIIQNVFFVYLDKEGAFIWLVCPNCGHHYRRPMVSK